MSQGELNGFRIFHPISDKYASYDGALCEIIRPLTSTEVDEEVGPMYEIAFGPNELSHRIHAFEDELHPEL